MNLFNKLTCAAAVLTLTIFACSPDKNNDSIQKNLVAKGLYSFGPENRSFTDCEEGREYWVLDSVQNLEKAYSELGFEKPYVPVYVEVECYFKKSDTLITPLDYDSTMVVTKLIRISKEIPEGPCSQ